MVMNNAENQNVIFPLGEKASPDYFTGDAWAKYLVLPDNTPFECFVGNVVFAPGARNNWHSHPSGQILLCTEGTGYYQEKGKPIQVLHKGDVVNILPDVVHWRGASHDSRFTHIAINPNVEKGTVTWLEKVTDEEYNSIKK
jgi:quercetin dioxygenase-like cupin family protein